MREVRAVFLDIDNTLYDYEESLAVHLEALRARFGPALGAREELHRAYWDAYAAVPEAEKLDLLRRDVEAYRRRIWEEALARLPGPCPPCDEVAAAFSQLRDGDLPPYPGMLAFVRAAARRFPLGVISNGPGDLQRRKLRALGVAPLVRPDLVFISHEVGWDKPDARIFRRALEALDVAPEACLMVGDDPVNDAGAQALGMRWALFCGKGGDPPACATVPDAVVRGFDELAARLGLDASPDSNPSDRPGPGRGGAPGTRPRS